MYTYTNMYIYNMYVYIYLSIYLSIYIHIYIYANAKPGENKNRQTWLCGVAV